MLSDVQSSDFVVLAESSKLELPRKLSETSRHDISNFLVPPKDRHAIPDPDDESDRLLDDEN